MTVPNPFEPYYMLRCYGPFMKLAAPWWTIATGGLRRLDGRTMKTLDADPMDAARAFDRAHPRPRPPVLPGQVWARYVDPLATNAFNDSTRWSLDRIDFGRIAQDGTTEGGRDVTTHMADRGAVLVYGPGAPWAPPDWAPGKVWDGKGWVDA